ncbi:MAG: transposase, partial [Deltaproteobacteria bacterium]|nr:transposase [Deltaproteobacteria bacterium]
MTIKRRQHSGTFKARIVLEALREQETLAQLASRHCVPAKMIGQWKRTAKDALPSLLERAKPIAATVSDEEMARLYEEIGRLKMENDS